ncbi:RNA methyltransferase [Caenispirillum bisanense]|uniref:TrmH family RNA methyltransferase n=1 Tax=Caenispirillum bisanense TaxID=414052 RepID=UPI0031DCEFCA
MSRPPRRPAGPSRFAASAGGGRPPAGPRSPGGGPRKRGPGGGSAPAEKRDASDFVRITGLPVVAAVFERDAGRVERLFFEQRLAGKVGPWTHHMASRRKPYRIVEAEELARIAGTTLNGGIVAVCRPREIGRFDPARAAEWARSGKPLVILDGVGNPHNLGAIVRTMAFFGLEHLVISDHPGQAGLSEAAHRVAEGGLEWVTLWRAERLPQVLRDLRRDWLTVATALQDGRSPTIADLRADRRPVALVLGNEEDGLPRETLKACETVLTLPGSGRVQSLNVAATAAILVQAFAAG